MGLGLGLGLASVTFLRFLRAVDALLSTTAALALTGCTC